MASVDIFRAARLLLKEHRIFAEQRVRDRVPDLRGHEQDGATPS
ncbi:MAG: hypothetical protein ACREFN_18830 [Acetobacteraceae bacterium]